MSYSHFCICFRRLQNAECRLMSVQIALQFIFASAKDSTEVSHKIQNSIFREKLTQSMYNDMLIHVQPMSFVSKSLHSAILNWILDKNIILGIMQIFQKQLCALCEHLLNRYKKILHRQKRGKFVPMIIVCS